MDRPCLALAALLIVSGPALAQHAEQKGTERINVDVADVHLADVLGQIGKHVGRTIVVDSAIQEQVTVNLRDIPWREAVDVLAKMTRCQVEDRQGYLFVSQPAKVTMKATDTDVGAVLTLIATYSGENIVFPESIENAISVDFKEVPWREALRVVADASGLFLQHRDGYSLVTTRALPKPARHSARKRRPKEALINIDVEDILLSRVLGHIGKKMGRNVLCSPELSKETLTIALRDMNGSDVLDVIAEQTRCEIEELPGGVLYMHQPARVTLQFTKANVRSVLLLLGAYSGKNIVCGPEVSGEVSLNIRELAWDDALAAIAAVTGLHAAEWPDHVRVSARPFQETARGRGGTAKPGEGSPREAKPGKAISLNVKNQDLADVMEDLGKQAGVNILVDPSVEETVSVSLRNLPWTHAVDTIARMTRCEVEVRPGGIYLLTQPPKISIQASSAPADVLFRLLGQYVGWNVATGDGVTGTVTTDLKHIHYSSAMRVIARTHGYSMRTANDSVVVTPLAVEKRVKQRAPRPDSAYERRLNDQVEHIRWLALEGKPAALDQALERLRSTVRRELGRRAQRRDKAQQAAVDPMKLRLLEGRVEALFAEMERLAQDRQVEELIGKFTELRQIMNEYGAGGSKVVKKKLAKWSRRLAPFGEVQLSIQLQIYINEGNELLRNMANAIRSERYDDGLETFETIKELKDQMYSEDRQVFHRNAEALFLRGKALSDRAKRLKSIARFRLTVSAIVVAPPASDERDSALIDGRIYREGDAVLDPRSNTEIEDLSVVEIVRGAVRFRYEDTEFVRELQPAD